MTRAEFAEMLADLIARGKITLAEAANLQHRMMVGNVVEASTPVPLKLLPGKLTKTELETALRAAVVRLTPADGKRLLASGDKPRITSTPPEVKKFLRERLRNHFRGDYEATMRQHAQRLSGGGDVDGWHASMVKEQRAYIARQMTAGLGRALAEPEIEEVNRLSQKQQGFLQGFASEVSVKRLMGKDFSLGYLTNRHLQYGGMGWGAWFRGNEIVEGKGDGFVVKYIAVDDGRTCSPCRSAEANGPYLKGTAPMPGEICRGHGRCRCRTEVVFDMDAWVRLGGKGGGLKEPVLTTDELREQRQAERQQIRAKQFAKRLMKVDAGSAELPPKGKPPYVVKEGDIDGFLKDSVYKKRLYRGTDAAGERRLVEGDFDPEKTGSNVWQTAGIYLSESRATSERFGDRLVELAADIRKPFIGSATDIEKMIDGFKPEENAPKFKLPDGTELDIRVWPSHGAKMEFLRQSWLKAGYDSIIQREEGFPDTVVALDPSQIRVIEIAPKPREIELVRPAIYDLLDRIDAPEKWEELVESVGKGASAAPSIAAYRQAVGKFFQDNRLAPIERMTHGLAAPETFNGVKVDGVEVWFTDAAEKAAVDSFIDLYANEKLGKGLPARLWNANRQIYFTAQKNKDDPHWAEVYKRPKFESAATGGGGSIMSYGTRPLRLRELAHESAHDLAEAVYGDTTPVFIKGTDTDDRPEGVASRWVELHNAWIADKDTAEAPLTDYGRHNVAEDLAESFTFYATFKERMRETHPKRFALVEEMLLEGTERSTLIRAGVDPESIPSPEASPIRPLPASPTKLSPEEKEAKRKEYRKAYHAAWKERMDREKALADSMKGDKETDAEAARAKLEVERLAAEEARAKMIAEEAAAAAREEARRLREAADERARIVAERRAVEARREAERLEREREAAAAAAAEAAKVEAERIKGLDAKKAYRRAYHEAWKAKMAGTAATAPTKVLRDTTEIRAEIDAVDAEVARIRSKRIAGDVDTPAEKLFMDTRRKDRLDPLWAELKRSEEEDESIKVAKPEPKGAKPKKYRHVLSLESEATAVELEIGRLGRKRMRGETLTTDDLDFLATADTRLVDLRKERDLSAQEDRNRTSGTVGTARRLSNENVKLSKRPPQKRINDFSSRVRDDLRLQGVDPDEALRVYKELLDAYPAVINTRPELMKFWRTGEARFKSQFETGTSGGANNQRLRARAEKRGLGFSDNPDDERSLRPIYGAMDIPGNRASSYGGYAGLAWQIKASTRARMTVTLGDSLYPMEAESILGTPLTDPGFEGLGGLMTGEFIQYVKSKRRDDDKERLMQRIGYIEWQCQGQLTIDDVESVTDRGGNLSADDVKWLEDQGVRVDR